MTTHLYIVTGSSRGVGEALVAELLRPEHTVLGLARHHNEVLEQMAARHSAHLTQWAVDLSSPALAAQRLGEWLARMDSSLVASATLINNAGVVSTPAPLGQGHLAELSNAVRVGLEAPLMLSAAFLHATDPWTAPRRVLNVSSGLGRRAMAGSAAYCAAKAGMDHFTRAMSLEQAARPHGARVMSIAPGVIDTDMQRQLRDADATLFPERAMFARLHDEGQLLSPRACAQRLLARLDRADFGSDPIGDVRD